MYACMYVDWNFRTVFWVTRFFRTVFWVTKFHEGGRARGREGAHFRTVFWVTKFQSPISACLFMHVCQKRPSYIAKETYDADLDACSASDTVILVVVKNFPSQSLEHGRRRLCSQKA